MENFDLAILVFACDSVEKYRLQMDAINNTWGKKCQEYTNIRILYFLGEERYAQNEWIDTPTTKYIHLPGVMNDYLSASYKQWLGLKYIYEKYSPKFTLCIGTDTYLNIPKLVSYLEAFNHETPLYIGGHDDSRQIGNKFYLYHSGGSGFIITLPVLKKIIPLVSDIMTDWTNVCRTNGVDYLICACDVGISYYIKTYCPETKYIELVNEFIACTYQGVPCCIGKINMSKICSCHFMSLNDFRDFTQVLEENNYFM